MTNWTTEFLLFWPMLLYSCTHLDTGWCQTNSSSQMKSTKSIKHPTSTELVTDGLQSSLVKATLTNQVSLSLSASGSSLSWQFSETVFTTGSPESLQDCWLETSKLMRTWITTSTPWMTTTETGPSKKKKTAEMFLTWKSYLMTPSTSWRQPS